MTAGVSTATIPQSNRKKYNRALLPLTIRRMIRAVTSVRSWMMSNTSDRVANTTENTRSTARALKNDVRSTVSLCPSSRHARQVNTRTHRTTHIYTTHGRQWGIWDPFNPDCPRRSPSTIPQRSRSHRTSAAARRTSSRSLGTVPHQDSPADCLATTHSCNRKCTDTTTTQ